MQYLALTLLAASAVLADIPNEGHKGGGSHSRWIPYFDNLIAFGDSYTDEARLGYFINHNGAAPPVGTLLPESTSTAGGGITWDRFVSISSGAKLYDYAVDGAVCSNDIVSRYLAAINEDFPDVVYEVNAWTADSKFVNATSKQKFYTGRPDNTVYSMWIGTNDLGVDGFLTDSSLNNTVISDYVDCIFDRFDQLYANGARYFVLMNTNALQLTPLYGLPGAGGVTTSQYWPDKPSNITEISYKMKEYTTLVNSIYNYRVPYELLFAKRYPGASIAIYDVHSLMVNIYNNPEQYLTSPANVTAPYNKCPPSGANCVTEALSLDHFMWFDDLHPSQQTDKAIAAEFLKVVNGTSTYATYW